MSSACIDKGCRLTSIVISWCSDSVVRCFASFPRLSVHLVPVMGNFPTLSFQFVVGGLCIDLADPLIFTSGLVGSVLQVRRNSCLVSFSSAVWLLASVLLVWQFALVFLQFCGLVVWLLLGCSGRFGAVSAWYL